MKLPKIIGWAVALALAVNLATLLADEPLHIKDTGATLGKAQVITETPSMLRGYGRLEATNWRFPERYASILMLRCEDVPKAKLTLAKYVSDLQVLPGVKAALIGKQPGYEVAGQGVVVAFRSGTSVCVLATADAVTLKTLAKECVIGERSSFKFAPEVKVPMWLDRWDRFGFRFYYSNPGLIPPGQTAKTYDISQEFVYAQKMDRAGFLFWENEAPMDGAECQMHTNRYDWGLAEAEQRKLPVGLNLYFQPVTWLSNRFREETAQKMPDFVGDRYRPANDFDGGQGAISWSSTQANAIVNARMADTVKRLGKFDCITDWQEPHCELKHGEHDILMEYGAVADGTFREFLRGKYGQDVKAVSQRWTGKPDSLRTWDDVHVPEVASFLGWGGDAISLKGEWKVKFYGTPNAKESKSKEANVVPAPETWALPSTADSDWPTLTVPGHDRLMFTPKNSASFRRTFTVPADWLHLGEKVWLYVWDLCPIVNKTTMAYLNGREVGRSVTAHNTPHWAAYEASAALKAGENQIAVHVPSGYIAYRIYLSRHAPVQYPNLGTGENARWADFADWNQWSRSRAVRNTAAVVRQVDPDRGIMCASPGAYAEEMRQLCEDLGGEFHDTGSMSGMWAEYLPMVMRGADLPFSLEPGSPAHDLNEFKNFLGLWETEGLQGTDYFQHAGDILWNEPIRKHFEEHQNEIRLIGKYHVPRAELGVLFTSRIAALVAWPWGQDLNTCLDSGYFRFNPAINLRQDFEHDGVMPADFTTGRANRYRLILDTNTSVMDKAMVDGIERYVRQGGVFVTYVQTGRHTPEQKDAWPIERLTGYHVIKIDQHNAEGKAPMRELKLEPGQNFFFGEEWKIPPKGNGLMMEKKAAECVDLMRWADDGTVAVGTRPLGKGWVITVGAKFAHDRMWAGDPKGTQRLFTAIIDHFGLLRVPAKVIGVTNVPFATKEPGALPPSSAHAQPLTLRHYESNNGLYDLWVMWNSTKEPVTASLAFEKGFIPGSCLEARDWKPVALKVADGRAILPGLHFDPLEARTFMTPRTALAGAPVDWLHLQQGWWRGGGKASVSSTQPPPEVAPKFSLPLDDDWLFRALSEKADAQPYLAEKTSAEGWEKRRLGVVSCSLKGPRRGVFRRTFVVPENWTDGRREFWMTGWQGQTFNDEGQVYLDGQPLSSWGSDDRLTERLAPGSRHTVAIEVKSSSTLMGISANSWLQWLPKSVSHQDLSGDWSGSKDYLHYDQVLKFPGDWTTASARRNVVVDAAQKDKTVMLRVEGDKAAPLGVLINGRWLRRFHHCIGTRLELNITPWVHFGEPNEIELVSHGRCKLTEVALHFYNSGTYP